MATVTGHCDDNVLADCFLQIPPGEAQHKALRALVDSLTHQHIRNLRSLIGKIDLHCDIVARLPVEISCMILQHLPLYQVFQARRVSRPWYHVLTSPTVTDGVLRYWSIGSESRLSIPDGISEEAVASLKAEHIDAFRAGHPFSLSFHPLSSKQAVAIAGDLFAWIDGQDTRICWSINLRTGLRTAFTTEERCTFSHVAISTSMIAATSHGGKCYVWRHRNDQCMSLNMPSAQFIRFLVSSDTLAIIFSPERLENDTWVPVVTWNLESQCTRSFPLKLKTLGRDQLQWLTGMLDQDGKSIVCLQEVYDRDGYLPYHYHYSVRTDLNGHVLAQDSLSTDDSGTWPRRYEPWPAKRYALIWAKTWALQPTENSLESSELNRIYYDFEKNCLRSGTCVIDLPRGDLQSSLFYFEDVAYVSADGWTNHTLNVVDLPRKFCTVSMLTKIYPKWSRAGDNKDPNSWSNHNTSQVLGDAIFQVHVCQAGILVLCFDKTIDMPNQIKEYRDIRKRHLEKGIHSKGPDE